MNHRKSHFSFGRKPRSTGPGLRLYRRAAGFQGLGGLFLLRLLGLGLLEGCAIELGLLLAGLEAPMPELGGGVDELERDLLERLAKGAKTVPGGTVF